MQRIGVARIELEHALQNLVGGTQRSLRSQALGGGCENLPRVVLLAQANIHFRQADPHVAVVRIHLENLLEDADGILQFATLQKFLGDLQVLRARVVEQALLAVEFGQLQQALKRGLELADLFVHRDGLDREALAGIGIAHGFEAIHGSFGFAEARIEIADGDGNRQVFGVVL